MKKFNKTINIFILILFLINFILFIDKFILSNSKEGSSSEDMIGLIIFCENIDKNILEKIHPGDRKLLGDRNFSKVKDVSEIREYRYRKENSKEKYCFKLDLSVTKNLLKYTTLKLFSPIAFETDNYRIEGKLLKIYGG